MIKTTKVNFLRICIITHQRKDEQNYNISNNLQRIISAPQLSAPVIIINIELIATPDCANAKKDSNVLALSKVSTPAPRHPSLLKNLFKQNTIRMIIKFRIYRLRTKPIVALPATPPISNIVENKPASDFE